MKKFFFFMLSCVAVLLSTMPVGTCLAVGKRVAARPTLVTYPAPEGAHLMSVFTVSVRQSAGEWQSVPTYRAKVCTNPGVTEASLATFDFAGEVEVRVVRNDGLPLQSAQVRPLSYGITPAIEGAALTFTLRRACNLSVEADGDLYHNLQLFANPIDSFVVRRKDKHLLYFGPGLHRPADGKAWRIASGQTVYVAGGAVLQGQLLVDSVRDVRILGRGIIDPEVRGGITIAHARNIYVEGLIASQVPTGSSDSVTLRNVKSISYYGWGDGMNVFASSHVLYDGVFCRNSDDCHTVYATRKGYAGNATDITMRNSVLWADVAHPIMIGIHGNVERPDTIARLRYENIDILGQNEHQLDYQGCMAINCGDNNWVHDVVFSDIRIEDIMQGQLINMRVCYNKKYCLAPGRGIDHVTFRNVSYTGSHADLSHIIGYNESRKITDVTFEHLMINGRLIYDDMPGKPKWYKTSDFANLFLGEHIDGVVFLK